jgi:hypothetical protein
VDDELMSIPYRIYHDPTKTSKDLLNSRQKQLVDCLFTRHSDGFVRQKYLAKIIGLNKTWVAPFVIQLLGEYVIEIIRVIEENLGKLDISVYKSFLDANPEFLILTEQRVASYWDCYYRPQQREGYAGFRVLRFFRELAKKTKRSRSNLTFQRSVKGNGA